MKRWVDYAMQWIGASKKRQKNRPSHFAKKLTDCMNCASMLSNRNNKRKILSIPRLIRE